MVLKRIYTSVFAALLTLPMLLAACNPADSAEDDTAASETVDAALSIVRAADDPVFYVSPDGNDNYAGTAEAPLATLEAARDAVRAVIAAGLTQPITIKVLEGNYSVSSCITLDAQDSGTEEFPITWEAVGEVVLNGGVSLAGSDFQPLSEEERGRLRGEAADKVVRLDLTQYGLTKDDWGALSAIGTYNTAYKYDNGITSPGWCEIFIDDQRQTLARYPNEGYLYTTSPVKEGDASMPLTKEDTISDEEWNALRNPEGDINGIDAETAVRAASWATLDGVWMFGYPRFDWADMSSPVTAIDAVNNSMSTEYVSIFGLKDSAPYYFYNVFEELDIPGEWYLNRETGMLYIYPENDASGSEVMISLLNDSLMRVSGASYVTLRGFTFTGARTGDALAMSGSHLNVENCVVKNVAGNAMSVFGSDNRVSGCEVKHIGAGGIVVNGGDRATLTSGNIVVENNYIHHFAELTRTYCAAVSASGVGITVRNNKIHDAPHMAIGFGGNEIQILYNEIYNVCLEADDSGAIYCGKDFTAHGNVIRGNYFHDIYSIAATGAGVMGVYCDDAYAGVTITHNVFDNVHTAVMFHGGHDMVFKNNLIINAPEKTEYSIRFQKYEYPEDLEPGGHHVYLLSQVPYNEGVWLERYPRISEYVTWTIREQSYPHYCDISGNVIVNHMPIYDNFTWEKEERMNKMDNNTFLDSVPTTDLAALCMEYLPANIEGFEAIPFDTVGIQE